MTSTVSARRYAALALAHRWFAFLETEWGNLPDHLEIFDSSVTLSGRRGTVAFARDRNELVSWFAAVPDDTSSHHLLHSVWTDGGPDVGSLSFVVAYQAPKGDLPAAGSIIHYTTSVAFRSGAARFVALDKTPVLSDTDPVYQPSWAAHRAQAYLYTLLASPDLNPDLAQALGAPDNAVIRAWSVGAAPANSYAVTIAVQEPEFELRAAHWQFDDSRDALLPTPVSTPHLHRISFSDSDPAHTH
ncbi:hypothetical protein CH304_19515 [Rhodococcus sp. 15-649-1-2]|nr:hypothetical protein [Rhodococcus sp. 15-649-1-2]OZE79168.1 hypothetical protein CH304_19515 [Rhodococcus sp. 15-649-1-2]